MPFVLGKGRSPAFGAASWLPSRQASWLAGGTGLLVAVVLVASSLAYNGSLRPDILDVIHNAVVLAGWALLLAFAHRRCADALSRATEAGARLLSHRGGELVAAWCVLITGVMLATAYITLRAFPNSADEYAAVLQAETLLAGRLWNEPPPHDEGFYTFGMLNKAGKWVGQYPPGWPAVIAGFGALGVPAWVLNPLLGLASLLVFYALCRRLGPWPMALAGVVLLGGNAFFIFNAASHFSHGLVLFGGLVFVLFALRFQEHPDWRNGLVAGLALSVVGVTRHYEVLLLLLPFLASVIWYGPTRARLMTVWIVIGGAPLLIALLAYYGRVTGDPFLPTMQWHVANDTIRFFAPQPELHGNQRGLLIVLVRVIEWCEWTSPPVLPLYGLALAIKVYRRDLRFFDLYFLVFIVGYFFYWGLGGSRYGPRYYHLALPFVILTILTAAVHVLNWPAMARFRPLVPASLTATLVLTLAYVPLWSVRMNTLIDERLDLYRQVTAKGLRDAVVIVADGTSPTRTMTPKELTRNGIAFDRPVLYVNDLGERNAEVMALYPDREFWIYRRAGDEVEGTLAPYEPVGRP